MPPMLPTIDLTTPPDDLWQRMRNGFSMPDLDSPLVADRQAWYLNRPDLLKRIFERSRRYLHHIVERAGKARHADRTGAAAGGRELLQSAGLFVGPRAGHVAVHPRHRQDLQAAAELPGSTSAATSSPRPMPRSTTCRPSTKCTATGTSRWPPTTGARMPSGAPWRRTQAKGLPTDYLHLKMPTETAYYVPKLQAIKNIVAQPQLFGISLDPIPNRPYFGTVERATTWTSPLPRAWPKYRWKNSSR
jgi:membrane-bound lytic murein transglycosylase D